MKIVQTYTQDKNKRYSNMVSKEKYIIFLDFKQLMYVCVCVFILKILHEIRKNFHPFCQLSLCFYINCKHSYVRKCLMNPSY